MTQPEALRLVERLREMSRRGHWPLLGDEAADEIERLRADAERFQTLIDTHPGALCFMGQSYSSAEEFRAAIDAARAALEQT